MVHSCLLLCVPYLEILSISLNYIGIIGAIVLCFVVEIYHSLFLDVIREHDNDSDILRLSENVPSPFRFGIRLRFPLPLNYQYAIPAVKDAITSHNTAVKVFWIWVIFVIAFRVLLSALMK